MRWTWRSDFSLSHHLATARKSSRSWNSLTAQKISFDVFERGFDLPLRFRMSWPACDGLAVIMRDEADKGGIKNGLARLPPEHDGLLAIIQAFSWHTLVILEGVLVPADEAIEVMAQSKVYVLSAGEAEDVGEALDRALACPDKRYRIGAPILLALNPGTRFEPDDRFLMRPQVRELLAEYRDPSRIARFLQFFEKAHARDARVLPEDTSSSRARRRRACLPSSTSL